MLHAIQEFLSKPVQIDMAEYIVGIYGVSYWLIDGFHDMWISFKKIKEEHNAK